MSGGCFILILPFVLGIITGKLVKRKIIVIVFGLVIGIIVSLFAGFELVPLLYPFMVLEFPWVGVPEVRRVGLVFASPDFVLFAESIHFLSFSLIMISALIVISVIGAIMGIYLGIRWRGSDADSPWEPIDETM
jgi:hypothetical protein